MLEYFKPYNDRYLVSWSGKIVDLKRGREVPQRVNHKGYRQVTLTPFRGYFVHRLSAEVFIPNPLPLLNNQVDHVDGNPANNNCSNLRWIDCKGNMRSKFELRKLQGRPHITQKEQAAQERMRLKRGRKIVLQKGDEIREFDSLGEADRFLGRKHKLHESIRANAKTAYGWKIVSVGGQAA